MPQNDRQEILRKLDQIDKHLSTILDYLSYIRDKYPDTYKDQIYFTTVLGEAIIDIQHNIQFYREELS